MILNIACKYKNTSGILTTENNSIIFIRKDGFLIKKQRLVVSIPYDAIRTINVEGTFLKKLVISVDKFRVPGIPRHEFKVSNPYSVMDIIQSEINKKDEQQL